MSVPNTYGDYDKEIEMEVDQMARRARALEMAREHIAKTEGKDKYDKTLNGVQRINEELRVARFLMGGYDE